MIRSAICCPGDSLATYPGRDGFGLVVGVNRAVGAVECDVWAFLDDHVPTLVTPIGCPAVLTSKGAHSRQSDQFRQRHHHIDYIGIGLRKWLVPHDWTAFTALVAMVYAAFRGADEIVFFGSDLAGTTDYDGDADPRANRTPERWARELRTLEQFAAILADRGVTVRHPRLGKPA